MRARRWVCKRANAFARAVRAFQEVLHDPFRREVSNPA